MNNYYPLLRKISFIAFLFAITSGAFAQSLSNYVFSTNTSSSLNRTAGSLIDDIDMNTGTTILIGGSQNNTTTTLNNIGFDFYINGTRQTQFNVTSNGWVGVGSFATTAQGFLNVAAGIRLAPMLGTSGATGGIGTSSIGRVHYKVVGNQPTRVLVIEFLRMAINSSVVNDTNTFQVRLYEEDGSIEYVYGRMSATVTSSQNFNIGFQFSSTLYNNVNINTNTASSSNSSAFTVSSSGPITSINTPTTGSNRAYRWTPNPPDDPGIITTSAFTTTGMTLNWLNATNEIGYALYRSNDGGLTYTFVTALGANVTTYNATGLLANTQYFWRVYSIRESISAPADGNGTTLPSTKFITVSSGNWSNPAIWNTGTVPSSQDSAEISATHNVVLDIAAPSCGTLIVKGNLTYWNATTAQTFTVNGDVIVESGGSFNAGTGSGPAASPFVLNIGGSSNTSTAAGNLIVNGDFDMQTTAAVQTVFFGTQNATVTGSGATCEMPFIIVNKGLVDNTIEFLRTYTQASTTPAYTFVQRLTVQTGTMKISAPVVTTSFHTNAASLVTSVNGRLWLNNSGISIGMIPALTNVGTLQLQGELRVDAGALTLGSGSNNHFVTTNGHLRINGGTVTLKGGFQIAAIASAQLTVNGGRLLIDPQDLQNLSSFTNIFAVNSSSTFVFTGGTIEIIDPHAAATAATVGSINIQSGGTRTITGGAFVIGDNTATTSGGTFATNTGFNIISAVSLPKLIIKNNISTFSSRFCRIGSNLTITDSLIIFANGYLQTGSAGVGSALTVGGNIVNNGVISGVVPAATGTGIGSLNLESSSPQTISGTGTAPSLSLRVANPNGVTFTNSNAWALERITLESGNVTNAPTSLAIGGATYRGTVVIGGLNETTTAGSLSTIPSINTSFGNPNYTYGPAANTLQTGSFNELAAGAATFNNLVINDAQGITANRNVSVTGTLTLTNGVLNVGNNTLTLGVSTVAPGTLARTSGYVQLGTNGAFTRWFAAAISPAFEYTTGFPLSTGTRDRSVLFSMNGASITTGGNFTVRHGNVVGYTDISPTFVDGGVTIDRRANSYWLLSSTSTPNIGTGNTLSLRIVGEGVGSVLDVTQLQLIKSTTAAQGTAVVGSGTNIVPLVNRDFGQATVLGGGLFDTLFVGSNSGVNPLLPNIIAINTGAWNNTNTWEGNIIPTVNNSATIATGVTVNIPTGYTATCNGLSIMTGATLTASAGTLNNAASIVVDGTLDASGSTLTVAGSANNGVTVNTGGTFNLSGGTVNIGPGGGSNRTLLVNGTLNVTNGTMNLNGNLNIGSSAQFNQSGGDINVDGNSGLAGTSTAAATHLVSINSSSVNCTAGNITIIDPPHNSITAGTTMALRITASSTVSAFTGTHTFTFGNGTSAEVGNNNGFVIDVRRSGLVPIQNVTVNAGNGNGRWVSTSYTNGAYGAYIKGNLTINNGSEFRHTNTSTFVVGGDITNNGTLTVSAPMTLGGNAFYVISNAQTISGTGTFRNSATSPTASFTSVTVDNGVSLTLGSSGVTYSFSGTLNIGAIKVTTGTNTVALTSTGVLSRTSGYIVGNLSRFVTAGSNVARTYEIGNATNYLPVSVTFPSVSVAGNVAIGTTDGDHPQLASSCINASKSINRYWRVTNVSSTNTGGNYTFTFNNSDVDAGTTLASTKLFSYNGTTWLAGLTGTTTTTTFAVNGLTNYGDIAIGEITPVPATISISASSTDICVGTNVTFTASITNGGTTPAYQWKVNGSNVGTGTTYSSTTLSNNDVVTCVLTSSSPCVSTPTVTSNSVTMTVSQPSVGGSVTGGSTICSGSTSGLLTLAGNTGNVVRWEAAVSPFSTFTPITNTLVTYTSGALTQTTQFRAVVQSGACASANSATTTVTVDAPSVAGSISGTNAVCAGSPVGNLTLTGNTGNVVRWESALAPFSTFTPISNTTNIQNGGSPTATIHYRAVVQNGSCPNVTTSSFIITVTPSSVGGTVNSNQTICSGSNAAALTLSGSTGTVTKWQSASDLAFTTPTDISGTAGLSSYTPTSVTSNTYYRAVVQSGSCAVANSSAALITVTAAPVAGTISGTNAVCSGNSPGNLTLAGTTGTISFWQSNSGSGWVNISNTSATYNPGVLSTTTSYRAVVTSGSCPADTASPFTVTVTPSSVGGSVSSNQTICSGSSVAALTLSGSTGTVTKWQSSTNVGFTTPTDIAGTAGLSSYTPTSVTTTTYYRAVVQSGACASANSSAALITVNPSPVAGTISGTNAVCSGNSPGNLTLAGTTGTISFWQSNSGSGWVNISNTTATYNPGVLSTTTSYRAVVTSGSCPADTASPFTVTVTPSSVGGSVSSNQTICSGSSVAALTLSGSTGTVTKWQSSTNVGFTTPTDIAGTAGLTSYTPTSVTTTTYYRAVVQSGACASANSSAALITVNPSPVAGTISGTSSVCSGNSPGNLTLAGTTGTISFWQSNSGSGWINISNTSATYNPGVLSTTTSYRAVVTSGSCPADTATAFTVTVNPTAVGGSVSSNQTICSGDPVAALTVSGFSGTVSRWQSATNPSFTGAVDISGTTGLTSYTPTGVTSTTYFRAVIISGGCGTANATAALITVNPAAVGGAVTGSTPVCSGSSTNLFLSGQTGTVSKWQQSTDAPLFLTWTDIANTATTLTTSALTQTTRFRAVLTSGSCPSVNSSEFEVQVTSSGIWVGAINGNWNNAGNWCGGVPTASTNVVIPAGTLNAPVINVTNAVANNVTIDAGATLAFTGATNVLDIKGDLTVNGTFTTTNGTVVFSGTAAQNVAGITYNNLRMNGVGVKTLSGNAIVNTNLDLTSGNLQLGNNSLTIAGTSTISNASASSYVVTNGSGALVISNLGGVARSFPVGSSSSYTPMLISNAGTVDDISVKILQSVYSAYTGEVGSGAPIAANVVNKTYIINEATAGGSSLNITFQWNGSDESGMNRAQTIVGRFSGGVWSNVSGAASPASGSNPYTFSLSAVSNLGIYGVGDVNSPLPVRLVAFSAKLRKGLANLAWTTASEVNTDYFEIERSLDGITFERIGSIQAKGNSSVRHDYSYIDAQSAALLETTSILFYRLKQHDLNGDNEYSNVVSVSEFGKAVFEITSTVPNPFRSTSNVTFKTSSTSNVDIQLTDAFGKLIKADAMVPAAGSNTYQVELGADFAPGIYFIKIIQDGNTKVVKLIKD